MESVLPQTNNPTLKPDLVIECHIGDSAKVLLWDSEPVGNLAILVRYHKMLKYPPSIPLGAASK
jgi:hypothetical protein